MTEQDVSAGNNCLLIVLHSFFQGSSIKKKSISYFKNWCNIMKPGGVNLPQNSQEKTTQTLIF